MKAKLVTLGLAVVVAVALVFEVSAITSANQENANMAAPAKPRKKRMRKPGNKMMAGVPMGVENCLNHLAKMAAADPLIDYEGHPSEIVNNGLLWNDPKSKCAVSDEGQRKKLFDLAQAWRMKDASKVRSLLQEMGATTSSGVGTSSETESRPDSGATGSTPAAPSRRPRRPRRQMETPPTEPAGTEPQMTPQTEGTENSNRRMPRRGGRRMRNRNANNSNMANSNSGF